MTGGDEDFELGEHTCGKLVDFLFQRQPHVAGTSQEFLFVEMIEKRNEDRDDVRNREMAIEASV